MRYLISGMPRCRTAWLTAVLRAHGSRAYHDVYARGIHLGGDYGVVDPAVALYTPEEGIEAYEHYPSFCIVSDSLTERLDRLSDTVNIAFTTDMRRVWAENFAHFALHTPTVHVDELEDNDIVGEIVKQCTKQAASSDIISTFQLLHIEEHMPKARHLLGSPGKPWISEEFRQTLKNIETGTSTTHAVRLTVLPMGISQICGLDTVRSKSSQETSQPSTPNTRVPGTQ